MTDSKPEIERDSNGSVIAYRCRSERPPYAMSNTHHCPGMMRKQGKLIRCDLCGREAAAE